MRASLVLLAALLVPGGCRREETSSSAALGYRDDIAPLLMARCASCHGEGRAEAGFRVDRFPDVVGCLDDQRPVSTAPEGSMPPLLAVLARADHMALLTAAERARYAAWVAAGAPNRRGVHEAEFSDPRSPQRHGAMLRAQRYRPLFEPDHADACGRCHEGAPRPDPEVAFSAPGATPCSSCHQGEQGVLSCNTCHSYGSKGAARASCLGPQAADSHTAHVEPSASHGGMACASCHPVPSGAGDFSGAHADGHVEVWFDFAVAGRLARFEGGSCMGTCHDRGGARPTPRWGEAQVSCGDCHGAPPEGHYRGACTSCHAEADAEGRSLSAHGLHLNGKVDVGDGQGGCGSCHGEAGDPWPRSGAHQAHAGSSRAAAVPCATCHEVPSEHAAHPTGGGATVRLSGLARALGHAAAYDATDKSCRTTYCHAGRGGSSPAPSWDQGPLSCGSCHASPPPAPHPQSTNCGGCHAGVEGQGLSPEAAARHVNGRVELGAVP